MPALVEVHTSRGTVLFEGEFSEAAIEEIAIQDKVEGVVKATRAGLSTVAETIRECAVDLRAAFHDLTTDKREGGSLSQAVVELGIGVTGEGNVVVVKGSAEANLKVTLTWDFS